MKKITFLFLGFLLVSLSFGYILTIYTKVSGVSVILNEDLIGVTDENGFITHEATGTVDITLFKPGYWPNILNETVKVSTNTTLIYPFFPKTTVKFNVVPSDVMIYVMYKDSFLYVGKDGENVEVPVGSHLIKVYKEGMGSYVKKQNFNYIEKSVKLKLPFYKKVKIFADRKLLVEIDGKFYGYSPLEVELQQGIHNFRFYDKGYEVGEYQASVTYFVDALKFTCKKLVKFELNSEPMGAFTYFENGCFVKLPDVKMLPEGKYRFYGYVYGYKPLSKEIDITSDTTSVKLVFEKNHSEVFFIFDGEKYVNGTVLKNMKTQLEKGIQIFEFKKDGKKWLKMLNVTSDKVTIDVDENNGTLLFGDMGVITLDDKRYYTPLVLEVPEGTYTLTLPGTSVVLNVEKGKVYEFPRSSAFLFIKLPFPIFEVDIDGRSLPYVSYLKTIEPGKHVLKVKAGCSYWQYEMNLKPGEIFYLTPKKLYITREINMNVPEGCTVFLDGNRVYGKVTTTIGEHTVFLDCGSEFSVERVCITDESTSLVIRGGDKK